MQPYDQASTIASKAVTQHYSTSFGIATRLLAPAIRNDIYHIYGLVRIADEIVDTYDGPDKRQLLDSLEQETYEAIKRQYSPNIIVHAFAKTAGTYGIGRDLIEPFFASMRMDITKRTYTDNEYRSYIYGSAEVVGLMCLRVFCGGNEQQYTQLKTGAQHLGSAFQKVNFLRDLAADHTALGRAYFPDIKPEALTEDEKQAIVAGIREEFAKSLPAIRKLPTSSRPAVMTAYKYYTALLKQIEQTPVTALKRQRVSVGAHQKLRLLVTTVVLERLRT